MKIKSRKKMLKYMINMLDIYYKRKSTKGERRCAAFLLAPLGRES
jgi:hypothetical protein